MFYTVSQIAEKLQLSQQCVYQLVERGKLVAHRFGVGRGTLRISEEDLKEYIRSSRDEDTGRPTKPIRRRFKNITI